MKRILMLVATLIGLAAVPAEAQQPSAELARRAGQLVPLFRGEADLAELFAPAFLAAVPPAQLAAVTERLTSEHGPVQRLVRVEPRSSHEGVAVLELERATLRFTLALEPQPPHRIQGLLLIGTDVRGDSLAGLVEELRALPGQVSFAVGRLDESPVMLASLEPDRPLAIGSAFKLWILAELDRSIRAGERRWSDVVRLDRHAPSGPMHYWPDGAPVTLHTLATLMISLSDNTATDMLLAAVGRERVERMLPALGLQAPERNRPFLSTLEAFVLKSAPDDLRGAWIAGGEADRRRILADRLRDIGIDDIDGTRFGTAPAEIETVEWFASAADLVRTMDWLRRNASEETRAILAVNPGVSRTSAAEFGYVGYKGGSEPGVINMTFLVRSGAGIWHAVSGSWNNPAAAVEDARFAGLMERAVRLLR